MNCIRILLLFVVLADLSIFSSRAAVPGVPQACKAVIKGMKVIMPKSGKAAPLKKWSRKIATELKSEAAGKASRIALNEVYEHGAESSIRTALSVGSKKIYSSTPDLAKPVVKNFVPQNYISSPAKNTGKLEKYLNKRTITEAKKYLNEKEVNILKKDLAQHPELVKHLNAHPSQIREYKCALNAHSPYRVHPKALKILKNIRKREEATISKGYDGISYLYNNYLDKIDDKEIEKTIARYLFLDSLNIDEIVKDIPQESIYLQSNKNYSNNNQTYKTDSKGRIVYVFIKDLSISNLNNNIVCIQVGDTSKVINPLPSDMKIDYEKKEKFENQVINLIKKGKTINLKVDVVYDIKTDNLAELRYEIYEGSVILLDAVFKNKIS